MGNSCLVSGTYTCPRCHKVINADARNRHQCTQSKSPTKSRPTRKNSATSAPSPNKKPSNPYLPYLKPVFPPAPNPISQSLYKGYAKSFPGETMDIKVASNPERTIYHWVKEQTIFYPPFIKNFKPQLIQKRTFQEKMLWFRLNMQEMRVSWMSGCDVLNVDRSNIVMSSKVGLKKINIRKQLKIQFNDEIVDDAGGLLREWMYLVMKNIFDKDTGIFQQCKTQQTAYRFVWDKDIDPDYAKEHLQTLGIILGKALFDRVPLQCYLSRTIWRQIASQSIMLHDFFSFDEDLYKSWNEILNTQGVQNLFLTMSEMKMFSDGTSEEIDLVPGGRSIQVNDTNKHQYIYQLMKLHTTKSTIYMLKCLLKGLFQVIPVHFLTVFEPHELQMMVNGPQIIDVNDWRQNTIYKGYRHNDQMIIWFWSIVEKYDQKKLANLLHYCTGTTRVPILGFKYLESNRNTVNKFTIEKIEKEKGNPYPRSYTCFNRLELPQYNSRSELEQHLSVVIDKQLTHFGLG